MSLGCHKRRLNDAKFLSSALVFSGVFVRPSFLLSASVQLFDEDRKEKMSTTMKKTIENWALLLLLLQLTALFSSCSSIYFLSPILIFSFPTSCLLSPFLQCLSHFLVPFVYIFYPLPPRSSSSSQNKPQIPSRYRKDCQTDRQSDKHPDTESERHPDKQLDEINSSTTGNEMSEASIQTNH